MSSRKGAIYFVEGLPGNGKTTTSEWLHHVLEASYFTEGALNYPNDFSAMAGMTKEVYSSLSTIFPLLNDFVFERGSISYLNFRHIESHYPREKEMNHLLAQWDIGDEFNTNVSVQHYITCSLDLIQEWLRSLENNSETIVMDSVWLQNPINELVFRNASEAAVLEYCGLFAKVFQEYDLNCIYLKRNTAQQSVEFASKVKGKSWTNHVAELIAKTPYGLDNNLIGFEGMIQYFTTRRQIEERVLSLSILRHKEYLVESNNWDEIREQILKDFLIS